LANPHIALNLSLASAFGTINYIAHGIALLMSNGIANNAKRNMISEAISSLCFIVVSPFVYTITLIRKSSYVNT